MRKSLGILSLALAVLLCACGSAALADSTQRIAAGDTVVFLHTGGLAALFAPAYEAALR